MEYQKKDQEWSESNQANKNPDVDNDGWFEPNFTFFSEILKVAEHIFSDTVSLQFLIQFSFHSFSVAREEISLTQLFPLAQKTDVIFKKI